MPARKDIKKILLIGSGPIVIGQACEFDYSGTQAVKALKEEGYEVILINPNPATVMTTPGIADKIYMEPLTIEYTEEIIREEEPDALLPTMGGQTGLNLTLALSEAGILEKYDVEVIGASIEAIQLAEDRGEFKKVAEKIGLETPRSVITKSITGARQIKNEVGLPLVIRPSFTLGGRGGSIAYSEADFEYLVEKALLESPVGEALIEESLIGWKEFELEVMRDNADNAVIVCSIENIDPMGIHTGDSITVAPIQTLSDKEYQRMRTAAIEIIRGVGVDCGGSNVQFAVKPDSGRMVIIEMNPRVSRSSALASKATGFPIALCSARLAVGYTLDEIINDITGKTVSCFEPALDYCAVKVPRFEVEKFPLGYDELGTQMKSVGESLALGRTFIEALNKAIRAAEFGYEGITSLSFSEEKLDKIMSTMHPLRIFAVYTMLREKGEKSIEEIAAKTHYDPWFIYQLLDFSRFTETLKEITPENILYAKRCGMSDKCIAEIAGKTGKYVTEFRETNEIFPTYHFIDTCAGEFAAKTPYYYSTYGEIDEGAPFEEESVLIIGSGPNRIGQGLEFDTCCTLASLAFREEGIKTIMLNSNPETVSTDFNVSDKLYIEPVDAESVRGIVRKEGVKKIVVQLGGQTPLNIAEEIEDWGCSIVGTAVSAINSTEDRGLFSALLNRLGILQPENRMACSLGEVAAASEEIGYPVLLRPSFVLGGRSMFIAFNKEELEEFFTQGISVSSKTPILVDKFLEDAFEYDLDALCDGKNVYIAGIMQHIEAAGIHSGDSACVFPAFKSSPEMLDAMKWATKKIALEVGVKGFLNVQFAVKDNVLYVLEVNPRASRTVPFLSKASGVNLIGSAVAMWCGRDLESQGLTKNGIGEGKCIVGWAVKEAVFSFDRFGNIDPLLGPEMKSTGEVFGSGTTFGEAFAKAQSAGGSPLPVKGKIFVSVHSQDRETILPIVRDLKSMGFDFAATRGTAQFLYDHGIFAEVILKIHEGRPNLIDHLRMKKVNLLINTPLGRYSQKGDHDIRIEAMKRKIPYTTTTSAAWALAQGVRYLLKNEVSVIYLPDKWKREN